MNIFRCPKCFFNLKISNSKENLDCNFCNSSYKIKNNFIDMLIKKDLDPIEKISINTWGNDLHKSNKRKVLGHIKTMNNKYNEFPNILNGNILEIGCGMGSDSEEISRLSNVNNIFAIDIGGNCKDIALNNLSNKKLKIIRANCLNIPFKNEVFDFVYSYGVIHHTRDPLNALFEIKRVLKLGGRVYLYVYSSHLKNKFKRVGIFLESLIMKLISPLNLNIKIFLIGLLSIFCWLLFSLPALFFKSIGKDSFARKFPMHWGKTPFLIFPDLKDRLLAPVNHRFSKKEIRYLLKLVGLVEDSIIEDNSGLYLCAFNKE